MSSRAAPPSELRWPRRLVPTCLADTFYGSWEPIAKRAALEAHALHLNLNRVRYQQRCRECGLARKTRRATHMFRSRFGLYVPGATGECFCGCLEPPGGRDTSGRASVQHFQISVAGKGLTRLVRPILRGCALLDPGRYSSALDVSALSLTRALQL